MKLPILNKSVTLFTATTLTFLIAEILIINPVISQSAQQNADPSSTVDGDFNNVFQLPNQNNAQNNAQTSNINEFNVPNILPLDNPLHTPVNTENDFGFNMSVGINTLDASNVTVYLGLIYHPGRTNSHQARMARLSKETELLDVQRQIAEAELQLLQQQIEEAEIKLQRLKDISESSLSNSPE